MFCHVATDQVIGVHDVTSVYHVPLLLQSQGIVEYLQKRLKLADIPISTLMKERGLSLGTRWEELTKRYVHSAFFATLAELEDAWTDKSVFWTKCRSCWWGSTPISRIRTCLSSSPWSTPRSDATANSYSKSVSRSFHRICAHLNYSLLLQWVDSSDLEPGVQNTSPAKYHDAWKAVVSAK